jgi:hypothetical protein
MMPDLFGSGSSRPPQFENPSSQPGGPSSQPDGPPRSALPEADTDNRSNNPNINFRAIKDFMWWMVDKQDRLISEGGVTSFNLRMNITSALNEPEHAEAKEAVIALCNSEHYTDKILDNINSNKSMSCFTDNKGIWKFSRIGFLLSSQAENGLFEGEPITIKKDFDFKWDMYKNSNISINPSKAK